MVWINIFLGDVAIDATKSTMGLACSVQYGFKSLFMILTRGVEDFVSQEESSVCVASCKVRESKVDIAGCSVVIDCSVVWALIE